MNNPSDSDLKYEILPDEYPSFDLLYKIIVIGNSGVGKSCLTIKATKDIFNNNNFATIGFEFFTFNLRIEGKVIKLQIWDTCGQEVYRSLISNFYRNSSLAIIVYAIDDYTSFEDVETWLKEIKTNSNPDIKVFLIGNKNDLEERRKVTTELAENFKSDYNFDLFLETSAKSGFNAQNIFIEAGKALYKEMKKYSNGPVKGVNAIQGDKNSKKEEDKKSVKLSSDDHLSQNKKKKEDNCC